jgi:hypothetical protein
MSLVPGHDEAAQSFGASVTKLVHEEVIVENVQNPCFGLEARRVRGFSLFLSQRENQ